MKRNPKRKFTEYGNTDAIIKIFSNNLFTYSPPEGLTKMQVEEALHYGIAALYMCTDKGSVNYNRWCCTPAYPASIVDNNNDCKVITTAGTDYALTLNVGVDCILLYNTSIKSNDALIKKYATLIDDIDKTIETVVKWARVVPIPIVYSDADIAKYQSVMRDILDGELINVISDASDLLAPETSTNIRKTLELTQPQAAEKLHFLSEIREECIKRLTSLYGIPLSTSAKSVQTLNAELHGMDFYSLFCLYDRYYARKESFERAEKFTGTKWHFDFSEIMRHQLNDIFNHTARETNVENVLRGTKTGGVNNDADI